MCLSIFPFSLALLIFLLNVFIHLHLLLISFSILTTHTWSPPSLPFIPQSLPSSSIIIPCLSVILTCSLFFFSQGDDGEIGPRGLPGESVSDVLLRQRLFGVTGAEGLPSSCRRVGEAIIRYDLTCQTTATSHTLGNVDYSVGRWMVTFTGIPLRGESLL